MIDPRLRRKQIITFIIITVLLLFVCALSVSTGEYKIPMDRFLRRYLVLENILTSLS